MDDDDTDEKRESLTLVNKLSHKEMRARTFISSSKFLSRLDTRQRNSTEDSDTMECASESEVENIPKDDETPEPLVTDEKGNRISGRDRHSLDVPEEAEALVMNCQQTVTRTSLKVDRSTDKVHWHAIGSLQS